MSVLRIFKRLGSYQKYPRNAVFAIFMLLWATNLTIQAQTPDSREYQIKAAFLFNFTQFVEWPATAFPAPQTPFVIGILGEDPFGKHLDNIVLKDKVNGHSIEIHRYQSVDEIKGCHILFINVNKSEQLDQVLSALKGKNILTVGDANNFARKGGMIRLYTEDNKMRLQINLDAAKASNLTISSKLLRLADIITLKNN